MPRLKGIRCGVKETRTSLPVASLSPWQREQQEPEGTPCMFLGARLCTSEFEVRCDKHMLLAVRVSLMPLHTAAQGPAP